MLLHHKFIQNAKRLGDKLAFIDRTSEKRISYSRALIASLMLAKKFDRYREGFIGIMIPTSAGCGLSILGALMSGRTPVMINYSTGAAENAEYAQKKCDFKTIITSRALLEKIDCRVVKGMVFIEDIMEEVTKFDKIKAAIKSKLPLGVLLNKVAGGVDTDNVVILFTSGSEKDPKAVQLTHANIESNIVAFVDYYGLMEDDVMMAQLPFFHVFGQSVCFWCSMYMGMTSVTYANPIEYRTICTIIKEEKPTMLVGTPSFFWGYLRKSEPGDFASVRLAVAGADKCPDALREGFLEKHDMTLYEGYGTTETSPVITVNCPAFNRPGSVGKVIPKVQVRVEHYETGEECAIGETGKILVKGPNVMKGYFDDFEETSLHIRHGWYDTGDMGHLDEDGYLWHVGRLRRFVKIGGEMVSLVKVEDVLEKFLPKDASCCLVEVPDAIKGSKIAAAVTVALDEKYVLSRMSEHLSNIALPKKFVVIEEFPKMGSGKIDFRTTTDIVRDMIQTEDGIVLNGDEKKKKKKKDKKNQDL